MNRIEVLSGKAVELLSILVGFDSVSQRSNLPIIDYIEKYLGSHDIPCQRVSSPDGSKCNLLARIGPEAKDGIILSGHTDVVPVEGQKWGSDPFTLTARQEKLYGRGTADMKSFIAICLACVPEFIRLKLEKPLWLAFSYDEEVGCLGAPHLLKHIGKHIPKPAFALIGEPTRMEVVTAHKGVLSYETVVHGLEGHSSQPRRGVNAVQIACELVQYLSFMAAELAQNGRQDARFDPPYTTVHVGTIHGGTARNIIPRECSFLWEIRPLPGDDADALAARFDAHCKIHLKAMKKISPQANITTRAISRMTGVTLPDKARPALQAVMRAAQTNQECAVSFGTEAGIFNAHGVPAIICGPGSIEQAHKPNEFIERAQIEECVKFLLNLMHSMPDVRD